MKGPALVVMARAPVPGKVKTRLQPHLTPEQSASLYRAFLKDVIALSGLAREFKIFLAFTPQDSKRIFTEFTGPFGIELIPQTGRNLGLRMYNVMRHLEKRGFSPVILVGSDIPTLQPVVFEHAILELEKTDLCLGPSTDGGYYLIGASHIDERVFRSVPWSSHDVLRTTVFKAGEAGLSLSLLEKYSDVDTFTDIQKLYAEIKCLTETPGATVPVYTKNWLEEMAGS